MYKDEEKEGKNSYHGSGKSLDSDSYTLKSSEIETIRSLIKGKRKGAYNNYLKNGYTEEIKKPKIRDYFTCMLCIALKFQDVFTKKNSEIIIGELNFNQLFIQFSLNMLAKVYKKYFYKAEISPEKPKIYPTFDSQEIKNLNGQNIYNNICSNSKFDLIIDDANHQVNQRVGLHLSLTRNHHISKKLSIKFLKNIIKKFNNCLDINNQVPEKAFISQRIEIQTKLKSFCVLLDYDSVVILKNAFLYSKNTNINGGIFVAIQIHHSSKINYLDPIIEIVDQACIDLGIQPLYSERVFHISLFYIKKTDLYLGNTDQNSKSVIETYNFREYLSSKLISSSINDFSTQTTKNIIWINKLVFRVGIYEYYLLLDS
ncbi:U6 snRNA phosphodiesterase Usb1 [Cryptosporidium meleagridis]